MTRRLCTMAWRMSRGTLEGALTFEDEAAFIDDLFFVGLEETLLGEFGEGQLGFHLGG